MTAASKPENGERLDGRHSKKPPLEAPDDLKDASSILQALDRELRFYRTRSGQVFFFGLLVEGLILVGRERIVLPDAWSPIVHTILFIAVAVIGIILGSEYRGRISMLKDSRIELLKELDYQHIYPSVSNQGISEIQVLYYVLIFLSTGGIILVWANRFLGK